MGIGWFGDRYSFNHGEHLKGAPEKFNTTKFIGKVGYNYDALVPNYNFNSGWKNQLIFAHVWGKTITNNNTFYSIKNQTTYFKRIKAMGNLALRVKLGYAKNIDTPVPPFAIDNNRNVRGSGNLIQRGSALWGINSKYRQSLFERKWFAMQANLFLDFAGIRQSGYALNDIFHTKTPMPTVA